MLAALKEQLSGVKYDDPASLGDSLKPILSNTLLFGVDLNAVGLGEKIEGMVKEMLTGPGAVRRTLCKYLG